MALVPEYRRYFYSDKGRILRQHYMDIEEDAADLNVTIIQTALRMKLATKVKTKLLNILNKSKDEKAIHEAHMSLDSPIKYNNKLLIKNNNSHNDNIHNDFKLPNISYLKKLEKRL